jgi:hypothetical protein
MPIEHLENKQIEEGHYPNQTGKDYGYFLWPQNFLSEWRKDI